MIRIVRGPRPRLHGHFAALVETHPEYLPLAPPHSYRAWDGLRRLIEGIRRRDGAERVERVLATDPAAASLLLGQPADSLPEDVARERARIAAHPESHLSHNLLVQRPLFERVAKLLSRWTSEAGGSKRATWLIPDVTSMDRESLGGLRTLLRRFPDDAPDLILGVWPERAPPSRDARGLVWEQDYELVQKLVFSLQARDDAEVVDLPKQGPESEPPAPSEIAADRTTAEILPALRAAFEGFAFTTVVRLGLELFAREPALSPAERAEAHGLVGLAAHNRQFRSAGNRVLARWLQERFEEALAAETRPSRRSCLAYRLAVTHARRLGELEAGRRYAEQAVAEARDAELEPLRIAHLDAWGRNIRAYVEMRDGDDEKAVQECRTGFELLDRELADRDAPALHVDPWVREAAFTRSLLADNLAALFQKSGDEKKLRSWKARADELAGEIPSLRRFEAVTWTRLYRGSRQLGMALHHAREGLEAARTEQDGLRELDYRVHIADLLDRMGRSEEALTAFHEARALRRRLGDPPYFAELDLPTASVALRAGRPDEARKLVETRWDDLDEASGARAEAAALVGLAAALQGDEEAAEVWMNRAIEKAVQSGERDVLLRVATATGDAARCLNRTDEAREAYERAVEIARTTEPPAGEPPSAADLLAALLGRVETATEPDPELLTLALDTLPEALEEAAGWALVPRLARWIERQPEVEKTARPGAADALHRALAERRSN